MPSPRPHPALPKLEFRARPAIMTPRPSDGQCCGRTWLSASVPILPIHPGSLKTFLSGSHLPKS